MNKLSILQYVIYFTCTVGILMGIDLLLGAKILANLRRVLDKTVLEIDKAIVGLSSTVRKTADIRVDIDDKIIKGKARALVGVVFIILCVCMILLAKRV